MLGLSPPARSHARELLDTPESVASELAANLRDIRRLNRWFGGVALARRYVAHACSRIQGSERAWGGTGMHITVLDVATGSADIPNALVHWARRTGVTLAVTGLDRSPHVLAEADRVIREGGTHEQVRLTCGDAAALPWENGSFDLVISSLALHHFEPNEAVQALREMARVAHHGIIVTDLRRGRFGCIGTWIVTRLVARSRLTRHDGPLSVRRAYTVSEVEDLARGAGLVGARTARHLFFRLALLWFAEASDA